MMIKNILIFLIDCFSYIFNSDSFVILILISYLIIFELFGYCFLSKLRHVWNNFYFTIVGNRFVSPFNLTYFVYVTLSYYLFFILFKASLLYRGFNLTELLKFFILFLLAFNIIKISLFHHLQSVLVPLFPILFWLRAFNISPYF